jgi:predicted AAA+ superfamily ATPase
MTNKDKTTIYIGICGYRKIFNGFLMDFIKKGINNHGFLFKKVALSFFFLLPHYLNFSKRLLKMPKLYFYDTGLYCSLLGVRRKKVDCMLDKGIIVL